MKAFTVNAGKVREGIKVRALIIRGKNTKIPVIFVGLKPLGILHVHFNNEMYNQWKENGKLFLYFGEITQTKKSNQPLLSAIDIDSSENTQAIILAVNDQNFSTTVGYYGDISKVNEDGTKEYSSFPGKIISSGKLTHLLKDGKEYIDNQIIFLIEKNKFFTLDI